MSDAKSRKQRVRLANYFDQPNRLFLEVARHRYWISSQELFERCGFSEWAIDTSKNGALPKDGVDLFSARHVLALKHLDGTGVEIGALNAPTLLPSDVSALYCDYMSAIDIFSRHPEVSGTIEVDFVDDGEHLETVRDESLDFIVANHFLEACQNPLGSIRNHLRKLKSGGVALYAVSDMRTNFNKMRPVSSFEHLVTDDMHGPEHSRRLHFLEYVRLVDKAGSREQIEQHAQLLMTRDCRIHFHVWDPQALRDMMVKAQDYLSGSFEILEIVDDDSEVVAALRKR
jgi:predicted SAM-dependent methyltransferase